MLIQHTKRKERKEAPKQMVATPPSTKSKRLTPMRKCNHIGPLIHLLTIGIAVEALTLENLNIKITITIARVCKELKNFFHRV